MATSTASTREHSDVIGAGSTRGLGRDRLAAGSCGSGSGLTRGPGAFAKIVCTIGPASIAEGIIEQMARAGMDVARLNFSHGTHAEHRLAIERIGSVGGPDRASPSRSSRTSRAPRCGWGPSPTAGAVLRRGDTVRADHGDRGGHPERASISSEGFARRREAAGDPVLIDDGRIGSGRRGRAGRERGGRVAAGGTVRDHKGVNLPRTALRSPILTKKDREDLEFGLEHGVD